MTNKEIDTVVTEVKNNMLEYLYGLDEIGYPNITGILKSSTLTERLLNDLLKKMLDNPTLEFENAVDEVEISLETE